jgi:hypothetical protein
MHASTGGNAGSKHQQTVYRIIAGPGVCMARGEHGAASDSRQLAAICRPHSRQLKRLCGKSQEKSLLERVCDENREKPPISPLRYPGFPVEFGGVGDLHAAFLNQSRTRGMSSAAWQETRVRSGRDDKFDTKLETILHAKRSSPSHKLVNACANSLRLPAPN